MADTQEQSLSTITPVDGDYFRAVDDPGGSAASANVSGTALKAFLKGYFDTLYYGVGNMAFTTSDFTKTSDATLANVTGLTHTVASGGKYVFTAMLFTTSGATGGVKVAVSGTATATAIIGMVEMMGAQYEATQFTALDEAEGEAAIDVGVRIEGYITVNQGGTLTIQFAQQASNGTASVVKAGSWFKVVKVG
jgi:hypothetical protein